MKIPGPVRIDGDFWSGKRVLVTGHTGFKGAWLSLWLQSLGASVLGASRGPGGGRSMYAMAEISSHMRERSVDLRDPSAANALLAEEAPEIVFHLAAQPLVRASLQDPRGTYATNVMGAVNLLEAVRRRGGVRAVVLVTSDKCYENPPGGSRRFVEEDPLGGEDPYSSSKACAELVAAAYRRSFFQRPRDTRLATARAGNVIGGGDWGSERLLPDVVRAVEGGREVLVRHPHAVRPWQHVLSALGGYLLLGQALWRGEGARAFNFGPRSTDEQTVSWILARMAELWQGGLRWRVDEGPHPREAGHLALDSTAAERLLGWRPACDLGGALELLVEWHRAQLAGEDVRALSLAQIERVSA